MLTPRMCGDLAAACHQNAHSLLLDAQHLLKGGRAPRALALAIVADEELAKAVLFIIAKSYPRLFPGLERVVLDHRAKQAVVRFGELYAGSAVGAAMREGMRIAGEIRSGRLDTAGETPADYVYKRTLRAALSQAKNPPELTKYSDLQATKNSCFYVDLGADGAITEPSAVATPGAVERYVSELADRFLAFSWVVVGNIKSGTLLLSDFDQGHIRAAWQRLRRRGSRKTSPPSDEDPRPDKPLTEISELAWGLMLRVQAKHLDRDEYARIASDPELGPALLELTRAQILVPLMHEHEDGTKEPCYHYPPPLAQAMRATPGRFPTIPEELKARVDPGLRRARYGGIGATEDGDAAVTPG